MSEGLEDRDALILEFLGLADGLARRFCRKWVGLVEPEEIQQEARLELVRSVDALTCRASAGPYIHRRINGALSHWLRDRSRLVRVPRRPQEQGWVPVKHFSLDRPVGGDDEATFLDLLAAPEDPALREAEDREHLEAMLDTLPAGQAAAIRLTILQGRSFKAVAEELGVKRQSLAQRAQRGIQHLREAMVES